MQLGDKSAELYDLHTFLIQHNYLEEREYFYGIPTFNAVKKLQEYLGVEVNGEFDEALYYLFEMKQTVDSLPSIELFSETKSTGGANSTGGAKSTDNATKQATFKESDANLNGLVFPAYIQNLITGTTIRIPVTIEELNWSKGNSFAETETKGRSATFLGYSNSTSKTLDFSFTVHIDILKSIGETFTSYSNKLEALAYPRYGSYTVPPKAFFRCGSIRLEGVVNEVSVSASPPIINDEYSILNVTVSMTETYAEGISATTIEGGK